MSFWKGLYFSCSTFVTVHHRSLMWYTYKGYEELNSCTLVNSSRRHYYTFKEPLKPLAA